MTLQKFPFDTQSCPMIFESFGYTMETLYFNWLDKPVNVDKSSWVPLVLLSPIQHLQAHKTKEMELPFFTCFVQQIHKLGWRERIVKYLQHPSSTIFFDLLLTWVSRSRIRDCKTRKIWQSLSKQQKQCRCRVTCPCRNIPGYKMTDIILYDCSQNYTSGAYPCLEIRFVLQRDRSYYYINVSSGINISTKVHDSYSNA